MNFLNFSLLVLSIVSYCACQPEYEEYRIRRKFHGVFCKRHPNEDSCQRPYTLETFEREKDSEQLLGDPIERTSDDDDFELFLWKKYKSRKLEKDRDWIRHYHYHDEKKQINNNHYYGNSGYGSGYGGSGYGNNYYYPRGYGNYGCPTCYPSNYYVPNYGNYGGYGGYGGNGGVFNFGLGEGLGFNTPIGGFGIGAGLNIGVG